MGDTSLKQITTESEPIYEHGDFLLISPQTILFDRKNKTSLKCISDNKILKLRQFDNYSTIQQVIWMYYNAICVS